MIDRAPRQERISSSFRRLREYVTTGYSRGDVVKALPDIDDLWTKLTPSEKKQFRQVLLKRQKEVDALSKIEGVTGFDSENCKTTLSIVELMKARINAHEPVNFDDWWPDDAKK
jgi:hypothetical protein